MPLTKGFRFGPPFLVAIATACALAASLPRAGAAAAAGQGASKTVFAGALDSTGAPIVDLTKADWGVREDGVDRPLVNVTRATDPLQVMLLVDTSHLVERSIADLRRSLTAFVQTLRAGGGEAAISLVGFGGTSQMLVDFGKPPADLDRAVSRVFADSVSSSVLLETLLDSAKTLSKRPSPRRAIVSVNYDSAPEGGNLAPQVPADAVLAARASYWAVTYRDAQSSGNVPRRDVLLTNLTVQSGGVHVRVNTAMAIEPNLKRIAEVLLAQYAVTYTRPDGPMPKLLQMAVARPGAQMLVPRIPPP
jgi:hypothetical protein